MIVARAVSVRMGGRMVLDDVTCRVAPGELLGIVGPNAAGKSTLLAVLTGDRAPARGEVTLADRPLSTLGPRELARVRAVVRQRSEVAFDLRVLDVVLLGRFAHEGRGDAPADLDAALHALDEVDLRAVAERPYAHLSGGEQRRVHIARALAQVAGPPPPQDVPEWSTQRIHNRSSPGADLVDRTYPDQPRHILLDEPLANLDLCHQLDTLSLLRRKAREGLGVAVVLHELALAARACDRLLVLHEGRAVREGPPDEVITPELLRFVFKVQARVHRDAPEGISIDVIWPVAGTLH